MNLKHIIVYSGTCVENYRTCAFIDSNGNVLFDKSKEPKHEEVSKFYFDGKFSAAVVFGRHCARMLEDTILIMEGRLPESDYAPLDPREFFLIEKVYVPKPEVDWRKLDTVFDKNLKQKFQELDPKELLSIDSKLKE